MQNILKSKILLSAVLALAAIAAAAVIIVVNVNQSGNDLQAQLDLGRKYVSELDYENAIIAYEKALEIDPYCSEAYFGLSETYLALGQQDKAIEIMEQAENMLPENVEVYISLTQLYASQNQLDMAVLTLEKGIQATDSDRLKDMLKEYQPDEVQAVGNRTEKAQPDQARSDDADGQQEDTAEETSGTDREEVRRPSVGIGLRQDNQQQNAEPVLIIDQNEEEPVIVPLVTPTPLPTPEYRLPSSTNNQTHDSYSDTENRDDNHESNSNHGTESIGGSQGGGSDNNNDTNTSDTPAPPQMGVVGNVYGIDGEGIDGVTIRIYSEQPGQETPVAVSTNTAGEYVQQLTEGTYRIVLSKEGYVDLSTLVTVTNNVLASYSYVMLTTAESQQAASLKGVVINATDSQSVEGATVALLPGFDKTSDNDPDIIGSGSHTTTENNGGFSIEDGVNAGYYTIEVSKDGYSTYHRNETVKPGENEFEINMSPAIETRGTYRIVLTWGSSPSDLDSHLICTGNDNYHVYFGDKNPYDQKASLDWDDTTSYGPETITVEIGQGNSYIYAVHNYSDRYVSAGDAGAWNLANSDAKVEVYDESGVIFDGNVPVNKQGTTWEVFRIVDGRLVVTNNVDFNHPSDLADHYALAASADETAGTLPRAVSSEDQAAGTEANIVEETKGCEAAENGTEETASDGESSEAQPTVTEENEAAADEDMSEIQSSESQTEETQLSEAQTSEIQSSESQTEETQSAPGGEPAVIPSDPQSGDVSGSEENSQSDTPAESGEASDGGEETEPGESEEAGETVESEP